MRNRQWEAQPFTSPDERILVPIESRIEILPGELAQIVGSVFSTMMGLELTDCDTPWFPGGNRLTSAVQLTGDWNGAVLMECDGRQACRFAARFLAREPSGDDVVDDVVDDDVRDVLGELANMIGGNLKSVLSRGIQLSMPSVVDGSNYSLRICGAEVRALLAFDCAEGVIWIRVLAIRS